MSEVLYAPSATLTDTHHPTAPKRSDGWPRLPALHTETVFVLASLYFLIFFNTAFLRAVLADRIAGSPADIGFVVAVGTMLIAAHFILFCILVPRRLAKPAIVAMTLIGAGASHFIGHYGVIIDPDMMRNVLVTSRAEAAELASPGLAAYIGAHVLVMTTLLGRVRLIHLSPGRTALRRLGSIVLAAGLGLAALMLVFQDFSGLMRNHKALRYLITPVNVVYSGGRALTGETLRQPAVRAPVGEDAHLGGSWTAGRKPVLFVMIVGETARAANWGLGTYRRQTTPQLAMLDPINFGSVTSCGTNTETSLPCMFSAIGRRDYDETRIRNSESLLHVLARAGLGVAWIDNQSGCKGVCAGLDTYTTLRDADQPHCDGEFCLDEVMLDKLDTLAGQAGDKVVVMHQLGNHGPAYHRRYPKTFEQFAPACRTGDLRRCDTEAIVNSYDNALLYTDDFIARTIAALKAQGNDYDTALIYVSDHGESLGEKGLYLHGMPYSIAPSEQTHVPMVAWFSEGFAQRSRLDTRCLRAAAAKPLSHDNLFHSILGLLDVATGVYEQDLDFSAHCRQG